MGAPDRLIMEMIDGAHLAGDAIACGIEPPPRLSVTEWADAHRRLPTKGAGEPGPWRTARVPYSAEIMECLSASHPCKRVVFMKSVQSAGPLSLDTPLPTTTGWTTMGSVLVGDMVFDESGKPCRVIYVSPVFENRQCYRIRLSDGTEFICDGDHRWSVVVHSWGSEIGREVLTVSDMVGRVKQGRSNRYAIDVAGSLDLPEADLPISPYVLGQWLANGNSKANQLTVHEGDAEEVAEIVRQTGHNAMARKMKWDKGLACNIKIDGRPEHPGASCRRGHLLSEVGLHHYMKRGKAAARCAECGRQSAMKSKYGTYADPIIADDGINKKLKSIGVFDNKHIPALYLRASSAQRSELLKGLMDGDGTISDKGRCAITTASHVLSNNLQELIASLGLKPYLETVAGRGFSGRAGGAEKHYRITFTAYADQPVFQLKRKQAKQKDRAAGRPTETLRRRIVAIDAVESVPVRCIGVDSASHLYLAGRAMVPTHNTEMGNNWVGWFIDTQKAPMMIVQPTLDMAERWSKQRLASMIEDCPSLRSKIAPSRARDSGNTTLLKEWAGGVMVISGANSGASLRSMPARYVFLDEVDAYPQELEGEGDPIKLAEARTTTFPRRKIFLVSTPTIESLSRINKEWLSSDMRRYHVPCPHCGAEQPLAWDNLRWPKGQPEQAVYHCADCGVGIDEHHKTQMLAAGRWVATYPDRPVAGFHINGLYTPTGLGLTWAELAAEWTEASKDPARQKTFINLRLGEVVADPNEKLDADDLQSRASGYKARDIPPGCLLLSCGVDVQKDRFAVLVLGFGRGGQLWVIDYVELPADPTTEASWEMLDEHLNQSFSNSRGLPMKPSMIAIDSGYLTDHVLAYARLRRGRVIAVKGASTPGKPIINKPSKLDVTVRGKTIKHGAEGWLVGSDTAKTVIFNTLAADGKRALDHERMIHFPEALDASFYSQLTAEVWDPNKRKWIKIRPRNEALDTWCYALTAAYHPSLRVHLMKEPQWARLEAALEPLTQDLFSPPAPAAQKPAPPAVQTSATPSASTPSTEITNEPPATTPVANPPRIHKKPPQPVPSGHLGYGSNEWSSRL